MKNISNNGYNFLNLKLSSYDYNDLTLSSNLNVNCDCINIMPITCILFTGSTYNTSNIIWDNATSFTGTINNFGITGFDNRYVNFIDSDLGVDGELGLVLKAVSGDTFCYNILSGATPELCGGFFQGHYKLNGLDYQVLPEFYERGWTAEIQLSKSSGCTSCILPTLNETYPNNEGIFYFIGTRAENKFCNLNLDTIGYEVSSGVTFLESLIDTDKHIIPDKNSFLFWNPSNLKEYYLTHTGTTIQLPNCCEDLDYNMLAFRITTDNRIGYRYLGLSGQCIDGLFEDELVIYEKYSIETPIIENINHLITIKFENNHPLTCLPSELNYGILSIYVDGYLKLKDYNFPNIIPYAFNDLPSKQKGVPFNISIGGGTQGLLETNQFEEETFDLCNYTFTLKKDEYFFGIYINNTFIEQTFLFEDHLNLIDFLNENISQKYGQITYTKTKNIIEVSMTLVRDIIGKIRVYPIVEVQSTTCCEIPLPTFYEFDPKKVFCYTVSTTNNKCDIVEENFAGTFIGKIYSYCLYDKPLNVTQIKCNYNDLYL